MTADGFALASTIVLLFPMLYFFLASPTFLLRSLNDPTVTWLLRGLINTSFWTVSIVCVIAAAAFALSGRSVGAVGLGLTAALAVAARLWFVRGMDAAIRARDAGDAGAVGRLRRLHWGGMLYNAIQFAAVVVSIPRVFPEAT